MISFDLLKRRRPNVSDRTLVTVGRWSSFLAMVLAIAWSLCLNPQGIFQSINAMITYLAPPMTCVFLYGIFWEKASALAAVATLLIGSLSGLALFAFDQSQPVWWTSIVRHYHFDFLLQGVALFLACSVIMFIVSILAPHQHTTESRALVWGSPWEALRSPGWPGLADYRFVAGSLAVCLMSIYVILR